MPDENKPDAQSDEDDEIELDSAGEAHVIPTDAPPRQSPAKRIHPRRNLPPVPERRDDSCG